MTDTEDAIHRTLSTALLEGRLAPGIPLREAALAAIFGVSRERIRKILLRLGTQRLVDLVPNRGAFVAAPSLESAREVYEARRVLEGGIVSHLAPAMPTHEIARLDAHMAAEAQALGRGDRAESVRLSARFHLLLAEATGNNFIVAQLDELVSRTSMLVAMYEAAIAAQCSCEEHREIHAALVRGDAAAATRAMRAHLSLIETRLKPNPSPPSRDPVATLRALWNQRKPKARRGRSSP
jgi:DNA-binding GntR family transcriptional regulator